MRQRVFQNVCLAMSTALLLGACQRQDAPENEAVDLSVAGGGLGLLLALDDKADASALDRVHQAVEARLSAFGLVGVRVEMAGPRQLRVLIPGVAGRSAEAVERWLLRPAKVALAPAAPGKRFFETLAERLPADGAVRVASDGLGDLEAGKASPVWYLAAADPDRLAGFLAGLSPPDGHRLAMMRGEDGAVAFLLPDPPPLVNLAFVDVRPVTDPETGIVSVGARLAQPFLRPFADLVRGLRHRPLAILVDDELVALPVVASRMERGEIRIQPSPLADQDATQRQAERLAASLQSLPLSSALHLVRKVLTPAGAAN